MALGLAACNSAGGGSTSTAKTTYTPSDFSTGYCPPVNIRTGTGTLTVYDRGKDQDQTAVRYLASITRTARECQSANGTISVKVGIAGRVVAGPKGGPGTVTLPVRIAVAKQMASGGPVFSQLYKVPVTLAPPDFGGDFSQVQPISFPVGASDRDLIVYVGFDEGPKG